MTTHHSRISRRTLLRGVGCAMALPWLESIPVWGAAPSQRPPKRFAALFMANGVNANHFWAKPGAERLDGTSAGRTVYYNW